MYNAAQNIVSAMETNIFSVQRVDSRIREEVPFFKKILIENINNPEVFHGYINKISETWTSRVRKIIEENIPFIFNSVELLIFQMIL